MKTINDNPYSRIEKIMEYFGLNPNSFANKIGLKRTQNLYDIRDGKVKKISFDLADKIVTVFPEINRFWIITGNGDMLNNDISNENINDFQLIKSEVKVPYYDVDFAGGWSSVEMFSDRKPDFFINNPEFDRCDFACNLVGKSVSKVIPDGSIVGFRVVEDWQTFFSINELYGIITKNDFRTVKRITKSKDGENLILRPEPSERYQEVYKDEFETVPIGFVTKFLQVMAYACFEKLAM